MELKTEDVRTTIRAKAEEWIEPLLVRATKFFGRTLLGLVVMIIALYFFLVDGPAMIRALMKLSPLDEKYEEQLIDKIRRHHPIRGRGLAALGVRARPTGRHRLLLLRRRLGILAHRLDHAPVDGAFPRRGLRLDFRMPMAPLL